MKIETLDQIGKKHKTDKSSNCHSFCEFYDAHLNHLRNSNLKILEIGIDWGYSLQMWADYFVNSTIYGADINMQKYTSNDPRIICKYVDQASDESLNNLFTEHGPFDIIIDDGSHILSHQKRTLDIGFNYLNTDGLFIMEDLHTSFDKYKNSHHDSYPTTYQVVQEMSKTYKVEFFEAPTVGWNDVSRTCIIFKGEN